MDMGLTFHGPSPEPPNRVPRMHNVVPNAKAYIATLQSRRPTNRGALCDRIERSKRHDPVGAWFAYCVGHNQWPHGRQIAGSEGHHLTPQVTGNERNIGRKSKYVQADISRRPIRACRPFLRDRMERAIRRIQAFSHHLGMATCRLGLHEGGRFPL